MGRLAKCQCHGIKQDTDSMFKVSTVSTNGKTLNKYYCSEKIYNEIMEEKQARKDVFNLLEQIFGRVIINTVLQKSKEEKEVSEIAKVYTHVKMKHYLEENICDLIDAMNKNFSSEYAEIRYLMAILKNNLTDYRYVEHKEENKQQVIVDQYIEEEKEEQSFIQVKKEKKKRSMMDIMNDL